MTYQDAAPNPQESREEAAAMRQMQADEHYRGAIKLHKGESNGLEIVLIRGLPGSGKSTIAKSLADFGFDHHEADHYFESEQGYVFNAADLAKAHAQCLARAKDSISRNRRCVVANTFTQKWEMRPYIEAAKEAGASVLVIEARGSWVSVHGVPQEAIERMRQRWEPL